MTMEGGDAEGVRKGCGKVREQREREREREKQKQRGREEE